MTNICKNCNNSSDGNFCSYCGAEYAPKRIDSKFILYELQHGIFQIEKGLLYTIKMLITNPGYAIRKYIMGDRYKFYNPVGFIIICSIIYSILSHFFLGTNTVILVEQDHVKKIFTWITENYNYSNLIEIIFIALILKWFFRKSSYNYFEMIVLLCYLSGIAMLMTGVLLILSSIFQVEKLNPYFPFISIFYIAWALGQFYNSKSIWAYIKSVIAYMFGFILFGISAMLLGLFLNYLNR